MVCRSVKESEFEKLMGPLPGSAGALLLSIFWLSKCFATIIV